MACDSAITSNDILISKQTKIRRTTAGCLFGCAGAGDSRDFETVIDLIERPEQLPHTEDMISGFAHLDGLLVFPDGRMFVLSVRRESDAEEAGICEILGFDGYAIGSGGDIARAAMLAGASVQRAVEIAIEMNSCSGPPVHTLKLNEKGG